MKRILLIILASAALMGCQKEEVPPVDCSCGIIANDGITNGCHWLEIRNDCTGNKKKFCVDQDIWMNNFVGDAACITGEEW